MTTREKELFRREREEAKVKILKLIQSQAGLYYSDIAQKLDLDLEVTVGLCSELEQEGKIETLYEKGTEQGWGEGKMTTREKMKEILNQLTFRFLPAFPHTKYKRYVESIEKDIENTLNKLEALMKEGK